MSRFSYVRFLAAALTCGAAFAGPAAAQAPQPQAPAAPAQAPQAPRGAPAPAATPQAPRGAPAPTPGAAPAPAPTPGTAPASAAAKGPQAPPAAPAPQAPKPPRAARVQKPPAPSASDDIRCWWDTDKRAVYVGEQFTLKITCSVIETARAKAVPAPNQFEPTAVQIAPFEVLGGSRHEDIQSPPWRYFQYEYAVRLAGDKYFGQDVDIPSIKIGYNVQLAAGGGTEGRDMNYILPAVPVRIISLVPKQAADIRDAPRETFADIEARRFRSTAEIAVAVISFGFAAVLVVLALVRAIGRYRDRVPAAARPLPARTILGACMGSLARLKDEAARSGWTPELAGRALTAFRIAGAVALGRPVAQSLVAKHIGASEGQIGIAKGPFGKQRALVSAPTTVNLIDRHLTNGNGSGGPVVRPEAALEQIRESIRVFNAAHYGRNGAPDRAALDTALGAGTRAVRGLRMRRLWPERSAPAPAPTTPTL